MTRRVGAPLPPEPLPKPEPRLRSDENRAQDQRSDLKLAELVLDSPTLWDLAAEVPAQSVEGRRRKHPAIVSLSMLPFASVWGSFRKVEVELADEENWARICRAFVVMQRKHRPQDDPIDLDSLVAAGGLTAQNFYDARRTWLRDPLAKLEGLFERDSIAAYAELGYASDPRAVVLTGDGKVTSEPGSLYETISKEDATQINARRSAPGKVSPESHVRDRRTGKIVSHADMEGDAHLYITGTGPQVGFKTVRHSVRADDTNSTLILAVRRPESKDEAACAVRAAVDLKAALSALDFLSYDGALHGAHIRELARAGLGTVAPITAASTKGKKRVEKQGYVATSVHRRSDGLQCEHRYHHHGGWLCEEHINSDGRKQLRRLPVPRVLTRADKKGNRRYIEYKLVCPHETSQEMKHFDTLRWSLTTEPKSRALNVAEVLREVPTRSAEYNRLHGYRQSVENDNSQSDNSKYHRRGRSSRADWNHYNEIGWAIKVNALTLHRHRQRLAESDDTAGAASPLRVAA